MHHTQISTSMGVKISAPGLEDAVAGTQLLAAWLQRGDDRMLFAKKSLL